MGLKFKLGRIKVWKNNICQNRISAWCPREMRNSILLHHFFPAELNIKIPSLAIYTKARHREKCTKYDISHTGVINGINAAVKDPLKIKASLSPISGTLPKSQSYFHICQPFFPCNERVSFIIVIKIKCSFCASK